MAEATLFSLAGRLLATILSPAFKKAYKRVCSIWGARNALDELAATIQTIQAVLLDAEVKQESSPQVKILMERIKDVLYKAEDLFDEVATHDLLQQQKKANKYLKKVQAFSSRLNPIGSNSSIASQIEAIMKDLHRISVDMDPFKFVTRVVEEPIYGMRRGEETGSFVNPKEIFGRDDDKKAISDFICACKYAEDNVSLIAIVGIGGMGKSTLAQLVYNDENISGVFKERRWWACISNIFDEKEITGKIYQSITGSRSEGLNLDQLKSGLCKCLSMKEKFLLVLDDLWDEDNVSLHKWLSLLTSAEAKGCKIIITTRSLAVAKAMKVHETYKIKDLPADASWELFKRFAFNRDQENDPSWINLGKMVMEKCTNVPLAIKSIASLLNRKDTMEEWISFIVKELPKITSSEQSTSIMSALKLSYDYLPSNLKHCLAYCSLFQKDSILDKKKLIYLWIAQGYVRPTNNDTLQAAGDAYFMELFRRSFFEEVLFSKGEIVSCKMHDLIHDLAECVAGKESTVLMEESTSQFDVKKIRHVSVSCKIDRSWNFPRPFLEAERVRSLLFVPQNYIGPQVLDEQISTFMSLYALNLEGLNIEVVPSSIGELRYLRYLNLSGNKKLQVLPDSITKLVNLMTLDVSGCLALKVLPKDFRKLISMKHLDISECDSLEHMPSRFGELTSLEYLSDFKVTKGSGLDLLRGLNLQGPLTISYDRNGGWSEDEMMIEHGQIPETIEALSIYNYPNMRIPVWWKQDHTLQLFRLKSLKLEGCRRVKHLPRLRCLPFLRDLMLDSFDELKYIEEEEIVPTAPFFPLLQLLELTEFPKLEGFLKNEAKTCFPRLSRVCIQGCSLLKSMPSSSELKVMYVTNVGAETVQQLVSTTSSLQDVRITACRKLTSFPGEGLASLRKLELRGCPVLENLQLESDALEELTILRCPRLELWDNGRVDWSSLVNLRELFLDKVPEPEKIPKCLGQLKANGQLKIKGEKS